MKTTTITLPDLNSAKQFANITSKYTDYKMNLISDNYTIDAHSIIGILSLDMSNDILLETDSSVPSKFYEEISQFIKVD